MIDFTPKTPEQELIRGGEAARLLDSTLFKEMRQSIEATLATQRRSVPLAQTEMHTRLILTEQLWGNIVDWFQNVADTGKMAEITIQQKRSIADRARQAFGR